MEYTRKEVIEASMEYFGGDDLPAKTFVDKYALHVDDVYYESNPNDMHWRLAVEFARIESKYPNPLSRDVIFDALKGFQRVVPAGSPMSGIGNKHAIVSLSNCVAVGSPDDNLSSIYAQARDLANLYKRRCGVGIDISTLRPEGAPVSNSAKVSSGAWSFADLYSYVTRHTAQQGRRGALMLTMNVRHPDILKFITMKQDKTSVTGANISVMITDEFMQAVQNDDMWYMQFKPSTGETLYETTQIKARKLWRLICQSATDSAEPGIIFIDNYKRNLPLDYYPEFKSVTTNPCSEILLSPYASCLLTALNLKGFVRDPHRDWAEFDWEDYTKHIHIATRLLDDLVDMEIECLTKIVATADTDDEKELFNKMINVASRARRIGLGTLGLADALACMRLRYDDPNGARMYIRDLYKTLRNEAYRASIQLAIERGPFPAFDWEIEKDCPFLQNLPEDIYDALTIWGRRNGAVLTNAPTGTSSIMCQTSSGIEPVFENSYIRRRKLTDDQVGNADFTDATGDNFEEHEVLHKNVQEYTAMHHVTMDQLPDYFVTASQINWDERVNIQGTIQQYIDQGMSSTINLPEGTKVEVVEGLYEAAYKQGLKGLTVYVAGSRDGILVVDKSARPKELPCEIHHVTVAHGLKGCDVSDFFTILVGLKDGKPYEVFGGEAQYLGLPSNCKVGKIEKIVKKQSKNRYQLTVNDTIVRDLGGAFYNNDYAMLSRLVSLTLRNGTPLVDVVDQLLREPNAEFHTYSKVIARVLKRFIKDGTKSSVRCPACESKSLRFQEGCFVCTDCGYAGCG